MPREIVVVRVHGLDAPAATEAGEHVEGERHGEEGGGVARAGLVELGGDAVVETPRDDRRVDQRLVPRRDPEEARRAGCHRPLVQVGGVEVDAERIDVERHVAGHVRAVGEDEYAPLAAHRGDVRERQKERGLRGEVVDDEHPGGRAEALGDGIDERAGWGTGKGERDAAVRCPRGARRVDGGVGDAAVAERRGHDLVTGREGKRAQHGVGRGRDVVDGDEVRGVDTDEGGDHGGRSAHARVVAPLGAGLGQLTQEEPCGVALHLDDELGLVGEDRTRRRADRSVVEVRELRDRCHCPSRPRPNGGVVGIAGR